jgi:hypothetical protein
MDDGTKLKPWGAPPIKAYSPLRSKPKWANPA